LGAPQVDCMGRPRVDEALTFHVAQQKVCEQKVPTENGFVTLATVQNVGSFCESAKWHCKFMTFEDAIVASRKIIQRKFIITDSGDQVGHFHPPISVSSKISE
ncbi:hypothetical protein T11_13092, partial [Trichinella zimbabwensis]